MNPALDDTGPDSAAIPMALTIDDGTGGARDVEIRGVLAYKPPRDSLGASEWNAWSDTPALNAGERVSGLRTRAPAPALRFVVLYSEREGGPLYGPGASSDLTRYQLSPSDDGDMIDFDPADFDARDFG